MKVGEGDFKTLAAMVQDRNAKLTQAFLALEESMESAKEYLLQEHVTQLQQLISVYQDVRDKVAEFFVGTTKTDTFATETEELFIRADVIGRTTAENLIATRKHLLDAHAA
jgi:hypothetical protein